jgi:hypothetical protein
MKKLKIEHELIHFLINSSYLAVIPNHYYGGYECDVFVCNKNLFTTEYEIKRSRADFNNDFKKNQTKYSWNEDKTIVLNTKHQCIKEGKRTNRFYFVVEKGINVEIPDYAGHIEFEDRVEGVKFDRIKTAPRIHDRPASESTIRDCLLKLSWRHYRLLRRYKGKLRSGYPSPIETPDWICSDCATDHNWYPSQGCETFHEGECSVCHNIKIVAPDRYYNYPVIWH